MLITYPFSVVCGTRSCCCGFSGFWWKWVFGQDKSRYFMVGRFAVRHLCNGFLYRKMTAWGGRGIISFVGCSLYLLEVLDCGEGVLWKECGPNVKRITWKHCLSFRSITKIKEVWNYFLMHTFNTFFYEYVH